MTPELLAAALPKALYHVSRILRNYPDDVEDVLQQACLKAHVHQESFQGKSQFSTWFVQIAINEALMYIRKRKPLRFAFKAIDDVLLTSPRLNPEQQLLGAERRKILAGMVRKLSPKKRREVLLRISGERTESSNTPRRKAAFHRAKIQLRKMCGLPPLPEKDRRQIIDLLVEIGEPVGIDLLKPRPEVETSCEK
jgi:RNA polymerase sigma factor (sigma-70 family)